MLCYVKAWHGFLVVQSGYVKVKFSHLLLWSGLVICRNGRGRQGKVVFCYGKVELSRVSARQCNAI